MAHTNTNSRPRRRARQVGLTLALVAGALVIPAAANGAADPSSNGYTSPDVFLGNGGGDSEDLSSSGYRTPDVILGGSIGPSGSSDDPITGAPGPVSGPSATDDGFDWASAAIGAGAAMALAALGGAAFLTVRRRTAVASSAA
jgi:hypothetical protein